MNAAGWVVLLFMAAALSGVTVYAVLISSAYTAADTEARDLREQLACAEGRAVGEEYRRLCAEYDR